MRLLRFTAKWCQPCRRLGPLFDAIADRAGVPVELVDVDRFPEEASRYDIQSVPTVVPLKDDAPVYTGSGASALPGLQAALDSPVSRPKVKGPRSGVPSFFVSTEKLGLLRPLPS